MTLKLSLRFLFQVWLQVKSFKSAQTVGAECFFFPPSFTPIQNKRQNCRSVYLNLYTFGQQTGREKILPWMIANILWLQSGLNFFWMEFWSAECVPKYLKCSTFSKDLFSICILRFCPAFCCRYMTTYLVLSAFNSRPIPLLAVAKSSVFFVIVCTLMSCLLRSSAWSPIQLTYLFLISVQLETHCSSWQPTRKLHTTISRSEFYHFYSLNFFFFFFFF